MQTFVDDKKRNWELAINVGIMRRVKSKLSDRNCDLLKLDEGTPPLVARLSVDVELLVDVLYVILLDQVEQQNLSPEDFALGLGGDALSKATAAFWGELSDFFRQLGRTDLHEVIQTQLRLLAGVVEMHEAKIRDVDVDELLKMDLPTASETLGNPSGNSPESSESIQTHTQLAS